jgi:diguanylate cyclase (GGDEF)-like protein
MAPELTPSMPQAQVILVPRPRLCVVAPDETWPPRWNLASFEVTRLEGSSIFPSGLDCMVVAPSSSDDSDLLPRLLAQARAEPGLAVVLAGRASGMAGLLEQHAFDAFVDLRWPNRLAQACLHTAIRHVQLGRKSAALQRQVIVQTRSEAAELRDQATRDELTALYNGRHFASVMEREHDRSRRHRGMYALLYVDLDNLKQLNHAYGHAGGSRALSELARVLQSRMRTTDMAARLGGDEFVAFLADCQLAQAVEFAERFCEQLRANVFELEDGRKASVTASIGVAGYPDHGQHHVDVLRHADEALSCAKAAGKDRVVVYQPARDGP